MNDARSPGNVRPGRPRPALFRALGNEAPPERVTLADGRTFAREETLKSDSWALTALYRSSEGERIVVKLHRREPILGIPMAWLGERLARRESRALQLLADLRGVPADLGPVLAGGRLLRNAAARTYVPGAPLRAGYRPDDAFFPELRRILDALHERGIAYLDLTKRDNVIVDPEGRPHLIDFQIHVRVPPRRFLAPWRKLLFRTDDFHLHKHVARHRRDLLTEEEATLTRQRPLPNRLWRWCVMRPFQGVRRRLLVLLGIRRGAGDARTEHEVREGLR